jgi:hypothetical protein
MRCPTNPTWSSPKSATRSKYATRTPPPQSASNKRPFAFCGRVRSLQATRVQRMLFAATFRVKAGGARTAVSRVTCSPSPDRRRGGQVLSLLALLVQYIYVYIAVDVQPKSRPPSGWSGTQFTCFTGTKVRILTKSTSTDAEGAAYRCVFACRHEQTRRILSLLALLVRKY